MLCPEEPGGKERRGGRGTREFLILPLKLVRCER